MTERCRSFVGFVLGHHWKPVSQIVPAAIPDTRTFLGQNGYKLETHHFCYRCRRYRDERHHIAVFQPADAASDV